MSNSLQMVAALEAQDLDRALSAFEQALLEDEPEMLLELGQYLEGIGFFPQAQRLYQHLLPHSPEVGLSLAQIAFEDGLVEEAFAYLEDIHPSSSAYVEALLVKADFYQVEGLSDVAREKLLEAKSLSEDPLIVFGLAELDMDLQYFKEAIASYASLDNRAVYELTGVSTYQRIGWCYAQLGQFEAAIEFLEKAVELVYEEQTVFELATLLLEQGETQKAVLYFKQLATLSPDFPGYPYGYAQALHAEHRIDEALAMLRLGLKANPFDDRLLLLASQYAYETHDVLAAESYLKEAQGLVEESDEVLLRLSTLYLEQERYEDVLALSMEDLDNVLACWNRAKAYVAVEEEEQALTLFEDLLRDLAGNPEFLADYIALLRQLGQGEKAREYGRRYLELVPDDLAMQDYISQEED